MADNGVGILGMEVYFPSIYVRQDELEKAYGVSAGKYTIGLGQDCMAFTGDREDINSVALTVVHSLLEKYDISPNDIGRMEIGTESLVDKSKSTKTVLMSLFAESGNTDIEGATVVNACYGGTAALLNALTWADSSSWDGRYAIVVAADIAVYADGPARPTGGCGAVAMLVGRNAPIKFNLASRVCHATHVWDFFKPNLDSEYPEVNGTLSQACYLRAVDDCYSRFNDKRVKRGQPFGLDSVDYFLFHSPYNKLVQKSFGRLIYHDMRNGKIPADSKMNEFMNVPLESTYESKELETLLKGLSSKYYAEKVAIGCEVSKQIGNTYTASVWMNLANLVSTLGSSLVNKTVTLFSYGSGALASMIEILPVNTTNERFSLEKIQRNLDIATRLASREKLSPNDLSIALEAREKSHGIIPFDPLFSTKNMFVGTYYLENINTVYERQYLRKTSPRVINGPLIDRNNSDDFGADAVGVSLSFDEEDKATPTKNQADFKKFPTYNSFSSVNCHIPTDPSKAVGGLKRNETFVWASGRQYVNVVVTGAAAALPGRNGIAIAPGVNNMQRIIDGENFIEPIPDPVKDNMLDKNVIELIKHKDGTQEKRHIVAHDQNINVNASIGTFNLAPYGIPESIASTMDRAVQVAVAAGLEALRDARILSGEGENGWVLPKSLQDTTGVVYATSFPALDAAIGEVSKYFESRSVSNTHFNEVMSHLRSRLAQHSSNNISAEVESALQELERLSTDIAVTETSTKFNKYEFDRKLLFRVLVLGNAQLAQIIKAKGPNMQTNAACAGATQAIALAYDMIQVGRAERMIVVAGDNAASDTLMPWLGNGFRALGAATTCAQVQLAALPFDKRRSGMILGSGGIGMVLESEEGALRRYNAATASGLLQPKSLNRPFRCRLLGTLISNSAYHGASLDRAHIAAEMERFISSVEKEQGITRKDIACNGVYFSHETSTHASPTSSCASNELHGLRLVFGEYFKELLILNTKGFTGHPMGVSFEDVVATEVLLTGRVPPIANYSVPDPNLGNDVKLSKGGVYPCKYAIRFAAGFGSQIALALYGK